MSEQVPVVLVTGYLGAGKTTWINDRIGQGLTPGALILVNDFGAINIDADLIAYRDDRVIRLSNGCICCSLGESLAVQLTEINRWQPAPSIVYIEASGVAQPQRIIDLITVSRQYRMQESVGLVDAASVMDTLTDSRVGALVSEQIATVDTLFVNRLSGLQSDQQVAARQLLADINPGAAIVTTSGSSDSSATPPRISIDRIPALTGDSGEGELRWQRFAVTLQEPVCCAELEKTLMRYADVLARAKGFVNDADWRSVVFQWGGSKAAWMLTSRKVGSSQLVGIGFDGPRFDALIQELQKL
ncbi:CobW family GTP-binding protein [Salinisphaera aquimarina]|uniref:CobW family GTP-binding protein n=1 Tax=Salinisphaera aquimarina TaxID=2094031 RepID=A0ABV7ERV4_9GAMM